jgi:hypothetical protein
MSTHTQLVKTEITRLLTAASEQAVSTSADAGPFVGDPMDGSYVAQAIIVRAFWDGRSIWVLDCVRPSARRVVAPGRQ